MRKVIICLLAVSSLYAMDIEIPIEGSPRHDSTTRYFIRRYFKKESTEIETRLAPHLQKRLNESDSSLHDIWKSEGKITIEEIMHNYITESLEEAFKHQEREYEEYKTDTENKLKAARYALITSIITGISSSVAVFLGVFFSFH